MLMRFDPLRDLDRFTQQASLSAGAPAVMPMDAYRRNDELVVHLDLPGVDASSIDVTVERNVLTVSAEQAKSRKVEMTSSNGHATAIAAGPSPS
jgi:HSP20 family protein